MNTRLCLPLLLCCLASMAQGAAVPLPSQYQGKPASFWINQSRSRLADDRHAAVVALGQLARSASMIRLVPGDSGQHQRIASLVRQLGADTFAQRTSASEQLGEIGLPAIPALIEVYRGADPEVARRARWLLERWLAGVFVSSSESSRTDSLETIYRTLVRLLTDRDRRTRRAAAVQLGLCGPPARGAMPALLLMAMQDPDEDIAATAVRALGRLGPSALLYELEGLDEEHHLRAARALTSVGGALGEVGRQKLQQALTDSNPAVRIEVCRALGLMGGAARASAPALRQALNDANPTVRLHSAQALWQITGEPTEAIATLIDGLGNDVLQVREIAEKVLVAIGPKAIKPVMAALTDPAITRRIQAGYTLASIQPRPAEALPLLRAWLVDKSPTVRQAATWILGEYGVLAADAVPALCAGLRDQDAQMRRLTAAAMGRIGLCTEEAVAALARAVRDPNYRVRLAAVTALGRLGSKAKSALPALREALSDSQTDVRQEAALGMRSIGAPLSEVRPALARLAADSDILVRLKGTYCVWLVDRQNSAALPVLVAGLRDVFIVNRLQAIKYLAIMKSNAPEPQPALLDALGEADAHVREWAADALGRCRPVREESVLALVEALDDHTSAVRHWAAKGLACMGPAARLAIPALRRTLTEGDIWDRLAAAEALWEIDHGCKDIMPLLSSIPKHPSTAFRQRALELLGKVDGVPEAVVRELLKDADALVRVKAVQLLRKRHPGEEGLSGVIAALRDSNEQVRQEAAKVLAESGGLAHLAVADLRQALRDAFPEVRLAAARALGAIGPQAHSALTGLRPLREDHDGRVRMAACLALWKVGRDEHARAELLTGLKSGDLRARLAAAEELEAVAATWQEGRLALLAAAEDPDGEVRLLVQAIRTRLEQTAARKMGR